MTVYSIHEIEKAIIAVKTRRDSAWELSLEGTTEEERLSFLDSFKKYEARLKELETMLSFVKGSNVSEANKTKE